MKIRALLAASLVAFAASGCGGGSEEETPPPATGGANAQELFTQNCANCHVLAAAGAKGQVGPDLDQLRPGPDLVKTQVTNGGGAMPAFGNKLSAEQIQQIADYVSENAGKSG